MARVSLEGVFKLFSGDVTAVHDLSLTAEDGEFLVLLGPSGCGKTTILRLIAGLETATEGEILIGGRRVTGVPPRERDIAFVFQNYALYPHMTAFENIAFGLRLRKLPKEDIEERVNWAAGMLGISGLLGRRPKALSGGERQRVALGRALVRKPEVFLFDEPLSNLDARLRVQMRHEIIALQRRTGTTAIYVTHDQFEAMTMGDRIAVLRDGRLQQLDSPGDLYSRPANRFVAEFIGTPPINILHGQYHPDDGSFACPALRFPWPESTPLPVPGGESVEIDFGIRPEALSTTPDGGSAEVSGEVKRLEMLGGEHHLYLQSREATIVARLSATLKDDLREGSEATLYFNPTDGHFFHPESGDAI